MLSSYYHAPEFGEPSIAADIIFEVKDKPHPLFKREGVADLVFYSDIPLLVVSLIQNLSPTTLFTSEISEFTEHANLCWVMFSILGKFMLHKPLHN